MLASENVIINSPMSFAGSAQRIMRMRRRWPALLAVAVLLVVLAWVAVAAWYVIAFFLLGLITVPYRLLRRGARKRKAEALRHREVLAALDRDQA